MTIRFLMPLLLASGCATTTALHLEGPTAAIRSAEEHGATGYPDAALYLQLAKEEMQAATELNEKGDDEEARSLLLRAEADAELAVALSQFEADRVAAQAAVARVRKL